MSDRPFQGRQVLVTGSSRGIGRATAELFAQRGADLLIHYRRDETAALETRQQVRAAGAAAALHCADLRDEAQIDAMMERIATDPGRLDVLVVNAASTAFKPLLETRTQHAEMTFQTSYFALLELVRQAVPLMRDGGHIITVSGFDTARVLAGHGLLGAAKAALETTTRYLAVELAPRGINVNCVVPGFVATASAQLWADRNEPGGYAAAAAEWSARTPRGRVGTAEDIARVICMLCSADARWITGQVITADGGLTLR